MGFEESECGLRALVRVGVGRKGLEFIERGLATGEIEMDAAEEGSVVTGRRGVHAQRLQFGVD